MQRSESVSQGSRDPQAIKEMVPDELVKEFQPLIWSIVARVQRKLAIRVATEDLEGYAYQGLLEAQERYDPEAGVVFSSFAYYRIRGAILDGCRTEGWLSRARKRDARREGSFDELLETAGKTSEASPPPKSFDDALRRVTALADDAATIYLLHEHDGSIADEEFSSRSAQYRRLEHRSNRRLLRAAMPILDEEEHEIIMRFYFENESMDTIGKAFGHSRSWVSRVHTRAVEKLRNYILDHE